MIDFDPIAHEYKIHGQPVPSVTQIISEVIGHGWSAAKWFLDRGKAIHACAAFIAEGKKFKYDERLVGYVQALERFFKETKAEPIQIEMLVASKTFHYAGTLDLICKIRNKKYIIDWKHNYDKTRTPIQIAAYSRALVEMSQENIIFGYGVEIRENGTYFMSEKIPLGIAGNVFLALRTAYSIKEKCGNLSKQKEQKNG